MRYIAHLFILVLFCFNVNKAYAQSTTKADEKTLALLKQFRTEYIKSRKDKKFEILQSYYTIDFRLMPEFQQTMMGAANALLYDRAFASRFEVQEYIRTETEVLDIGERVIETGVIEMKIKTKSTGQQQEIKGKYLDLWTRENGKLMLVTQAWNYNHGFPNEREMVFSEVPVVNVALQAHVPIANAVSFELAALNRLMEKTVSDHDEKLWLQFYADDAVFLYSRSPAQAGTQALREFLDHHVKGLPVFEKLDVRNDRIDDLDNYVIEYASHIAIIRHGDFSGVFTGKDLAIWRREPNGSLKLFRHIGMYD